MIYYHVERNFLCSTKHKLDMIFYIMCVEFLVVLIRKKDGN